MLKRFFVLALAAALGSCHGIPSGGIAGNVRADHTGEREAESRRSETALPAKIPALTGQTIAHRGYHIQLTDLLEDFARGATVSLIEVTSGITRGTSLADDAGRFKIEFGDAFRPARPAPDSRLSVAYYLEAIRGVKGPNPVFNQSGADALRLRTLVFFDFEADGWVSLANSVPGRLTISISTSTVAFFINQQVLDGKTVASAAFIGSVDPAMATQAPEDYTPTGDLGRALYGELFAQVTNAVSADQDPIHALVITSDGRVVNTQTDLGISSLDPATGSIGGTIRILGRGFDPRTAEVEFVGGLAEVDEGASSPNALSVRVPPGARGGLIRVAVNGKDAYSPPFKILTEDGHRTTFTDQDGNTHLYAVSADFGTLLRIDPDGTTTNLSSALSEPWAVLVNPEGSQGPGYRIYVADRGANRISQFDQTGAVLTAGWLTATDPKALVLGPDGDLYVAQGSGNSILRSRVNWGAGTIQTATVATYSGFSDPVALAFDFSGRLYVAERGSDRVRRFLPGIGDSGSIAPASVEPWAALSAPDGITIDTAGNSYITSQTNNVVVRVDPFRNMTPFRTISGARSISRDPSGNMYVVDRTRNLIVRLTQSGDQRIQAYGFAGPTGIAADEDGNVFVGLRSAGAVLKLSNDGVHTRPLATGIAAPDGLTFRNGKIYVAHTDTHNATEIRLDGSVRSLVPSGLQGPGGIEIGEDGTVYAGRLNYYERGPWEALPGIGGPMYHSMNFNGLDVVGTDRTITRRLPLIKYLASDTNDLSQGIVQIDDLRWAESRRSRKMVVMTTDHSGGRYAQKIENITPAFAGQKVFPDQALDLAYDGDRYLYVPCRDGNVYRIDLQNVNDAPGIIGGTPGLPNSVTLIGSGAGATLYILDRTNKTLRRAGNPRTATAIDSGWAAGTGAGDPVAIAAYGSDVYVSDFSGKRIMKVNVGSGTPTGTVYRDNLAASPSRLRFYPDGRLLVRASDTRWYRIAANAAGIEQFWDLSSGGSFREFTIVGAGTEVALNASLERSVRANGIVFSRELARDGDWLYIASHMPGYHSGVYGINLASGEELYVGDLGTPSGLAADPVGRDVFVLDTGGSYYSVDFATRQRIGRGGLGSSGWGLDYHAASRKLYATSPGTQRVYRIDRDSWGVSTLKVGLHEPRF